MGCRAVRSGYVCLRGHVNGLFGVKCDIHIDDRLDGYML